MTSTLLADASVFQKSLLKAYPTYSDLLTSIDQSYTQVCPTNSLLLGQLKQSLNQSAPFQPFYTETNPTSAITDIMVDTGTSMISEEFNRLGNLSTPVVTYVTQTMSKVPNTTLGGALGSYIDTYISFDDLPTYPWATDLANSIGMAGAAFSISAGAANIALSSDPANEAFKQGTIFEAGVMADLLTTAALGGMVAIGALPALPVIAVAGISALIGGITAAIVDANWNSIVAATKSSTAQEIGNLFAQDLLTAFTSTTLPTSLLAQGLNWAGSIFGGLSNANAPSATFALPAWVQKILAQYQTALTYVSPLVLDLSGKGINLTALNSSVANGETVAPVYFDMQNSGFGIQTGWIGAGSGLLAIDLNGNGTIDSQSELFGNQSGVSGSDGFSSLAALDSNHDGKITAADADFSKLRVWEDLNQDGVSEPGELFTLAQLGITSISLNDTVVNKTIAGNLVTEQSTFTINGKTQSIDDVWFADNPVNSTYEGNYTLNPQALLLPQLRGYGTLPDLTIAMSQNSALMAAVLQLTKLNIVSNPASASPLIQQIMYLWAGVQNISANTQAGFDSRDVAFLTKYFDQPAENPYGGSTVGSSAGEALQALFSQIQSQITGRLLLQSVGAQFFSSVPTYNLSTDSFSGTTTLNIAAIDAATKNLSTASAAQQWLNIFAMINGTIGLANLPSATQSQISAAILASDPSGALNYQILTNAITNGATLILGTAGSDTITLNSGTNLTLGLGGNDTFSASGGLQEICGGQGNDKFSLGELSAGSIINGAGGYNTIVTSSDLSALNISQVQEIDVNGSVGLTAQEFAAVSKLANNNGYVENINLVEPGTIDLSKKQVVGAFNLYGSATGNDVLVGNTATQAIYAGGGNDTLDAGSGNETITAGTGNDILNGGAGNDTFVVQGGGVDALNGGSGNDTFEVNLASNGSTINGGGGSNIIELSYNISNIAITNVQELDVKSETILTASQLGGFKKVVNSSGGFNATLIAAGAGTYDLTKGDVIGKFNMQGSSTGNDILIGNSLTQSITAGGGSDTIYAGGGNETLTAGFGADVIYGGSGNDIFYANSGLQKLYGGVGNDTFNIGQLTTGSVISGGGGTNVIVANQSDISAVTLSGIQELEIGSSVTLTASELSQLPSVVAEPQYYGSWLDASGSGAFDLTKEKVTGTVNLQASYSGNDVLIGNTATKFLVAESGNDTLNANGGQATLDGGSGIDTFVFGRGYGSDTINENSKSSNNDLLSLNAGVARDQLWFSKNGNDLIMQIIGTNDKLTVSGWYSSASDQVSKIKTSDGHVLTSVKVQNLVNAMASLAVPATTTLSTADQSKLEPVIAANWT